MDNFCSNCGAKILNEKQDICLNCGILLKRQYNINSRGIKTNSMAVAGFIVALCSLILNFGGIIGVIATLLSGIGISQINSSKEKGIGFAIAGLIIGIISIIYGIISIITLPEIFL